MSSLEELDPSVADGYRVIYDREVPVECRTRSGSEDARQGVLESIKVKMLMLGGEEAPSSIRIELSSEADLFFHYMHVIDTQAFSGVQSAQKLMMRIMRSQRAQRGCACMWLMQGRECGVVGGLGGVNGRKCVCAYCC